MEVSEALTEKFTIREKIGSGSFGEIYSGTCKQTNQLIALKLEKPRNGRSYLENEYKTLRLLQGGIGIPKTFSYTFDLSGNFMSMDLLGPSLENLLKPCRGKFSLKTVLMIADQCISRIEFVHSQNFLHRDIKPENFVIGLNRKAHIVHLIDFGLSKRYLDPITLRHIRYKEGKSLTGTARYASVNTHQGIEQSRRDDLESLFYTLLYFLQGTLPWTNLPIKQKKERYKQILNLKSSIPVETLVHPFPLEFSQYLLYCRSIKFEQKPDYTYLKRLFKDLFTKLNFKYDYIFEWDLRRNPCKSSKYAQKDINVTVRETSRSRMLKRRELSPEPDSQVFLNFPHKFRSFMNLSQLPSIDLKGKNAKISLN